MIDIHTHVLPGVDDGADSLEETVAMLRVAHESGTRTVVATPHLFHPSFSTPDLERVRADFDRLTEHLDEMANKEGFEFLSEMDLLPGGENFWGSRFAQSLSANRVMTINRGRFVLVEFFPMSSRGQLLQGTEILISAGFVPVLAHVERYAVVVREPRVLQEFLGRGCLTQLNAESLDGRRWSRRRRLALSLLDEDSDIAHRNGRPWFHHANSKHDRRSPDAGAKVLGGAGSKVDRRISPLGHPGEPGLTRIMQETVVRC